MNETGWSQQADFPILSALILLPLLAMGGAWMARSARQAFLLGSIAALLELFLAVALLEWVEPMSADLQLTERVQILPFLSYHLGVDGISVLFVALTAFLTLMVIFYGEIVHESPAGIYVASVFAFQAVLMGLFLSIDVLEFWIVSLLELIPAGFILHRWGEGPQKRRALGRYLQNMGGGLALMLAAIVIIGWHRAEAVGDWSFALTDLLAAPMPKTQQSLAFVLFFYGLSVRMALFPFHAWLPMVAQHGPLATVCVFLVGLKVGVYALLRFVAPLLPEGAHEWKGFAVGLAVAGLFYGALMALMQINLRRLLAYSAVSQTGMLVIGVFCLNREGFAGSLLLAINFGVAAAALLFVTGVVYRSTHTTFLPRLGGLFDALPLLGLTFLLAALSTMAMPGTPGFDAAHLMLEGAIETHSWGVAVAMAAGSVASAAFLLWAFQRAFLAKRRDNALHPEKIRLSTPEALLVGSLCAVQLAVGFYTEPWLEIVDGGLARLAQHIEHSQSGRR
jgi:NADH-quinone oxidoreductase subunit M